MRRRILYIMHVDWDWAKQRPHFLAEHLADDHDVVVLYPYARERKHLVKNDRLKGRLLPFFPVALLGRFLFARKIIRIAVRIMMQVMLKWYRPDLIWISSPELFVYLPKPLPCKLIYDCMDDILAFPANAPLRDSLAALEGELVSASARVFCSSKNLRDRLVIRAGSPEKYVVIHNAFEPSAFLDISKNAESVKSGTKHILGYIGTISSWLDFEALVKIVNEFSMIEVHLLGPIENSGVALPQHKRIKYLGAVRHGDIQMYVSGFDALLMPFHVTKLVQSVDPVKLYEYVFFNKPIVSVRYTEIERFSEFVDFYINHQELILILNRYLSEGFRQKYSDAQRLQFINSNTWSDRVNKIQEYLPN